MEVSNYDDNLYFQQIISNPENRILIYSDNGSGHIEGFIDTETSFGTSAEYGTENMGGDTVKSASDGMSKLTNATGIGGSMKLQPQKLSRVTWQSSSLNALSFEIYLPTYDDMVDVMKPALKIFDFTLPTAAGLGYVYMPNHYNVNQAGSQQGTLGLKLGYWFHAPKAWVMASGNITLSKERVKMKNGQSRPLYVKISVVLRPAMDFYADQVKSWFLGGNRSSGSLRTISGSTARNNAKNFLSGFIGGLF